jgi:hypothetical protein
MTPSIPFDPVSLTARRTSRTGRLIHGNYFNTTALDELGSTSDEGLAWRIDTLRDYAMQLGFTSVFDAALATAQSKTNTARQEFSHFVSSGGMHDLFVGSQSLRITNATLEDSLRHSICAPALAIYQLEWQKLLNDQSLRQPLAGFTPEFIDKFEFETIYNGMRSNAPHFLDLLETITSKPSEPFPLQRLKMRQQQRFIVMAISTLARLRSQRINIVQGPLSYFLFASRVSSKVFEVLNHLGICASYSTIQAALASNAVSCRRRLRSVGQMNIAYQISFDNVTAATNVRDERGYNRAGFWSATAGFCALPHPEIAHPMFTQADMHYNLAHFLTVDDFLPSDEDQNVLRLAFQSLMWDTLRRFCKSRDIALARCNFPMPKVAPLDPHHCPTILTLPTYDLEEGKISDMIQIHYRVSEDTGLSVESTPNVVVMCKGDYMTSANSRFGPHNAFY